MNRRCRRRTGRYNAVSNTRATMSLHLYNTMTRRAEPFVPLDPASPTMYVCGPTVYNYVHIGNARGPVVFGVLAALLRRRFGGLRYARNQVLVSSGAKQTIYNLCMAVLDAGEDGFVPYGCIVSEGKVPAVVGAGEVPVFAIIAPELLEGIGSPLRELLGSVCAAA